MTLTRLNGNANLDPLSKDETRIYNPKGAWRANAAFGLPVRVAGIKSRTIRLKSHLQRVVEVYCRHRLESFQRRFPDSAAVRFSLLIGFLLLLPASSGCKVSDILFNALGSHNYTGGGSTPAERQDHFQRQAQEFEDIQKFSGSESKPQPPWDSS